MTVSAVQKRRLAAVSRHGKRNENARRRIARQQSGVFGGGQSQW